MPRPLGKYFADGDEQNQFDRVLHAISQLKQQQILQYQGLLQTTERQHEDLLMSLSQLSTDIIERYQMSTFEVGEGPVRTNSSGTIRTNSSARCSILTSTMSARIKMEMEQKQQQLLEMGQRRTNLFPNSLETTPLRHESYVRHVAVKMLEYHCTVQKHEFKLFEMLICAVILLNVLVVGIESEWSLRNMNSPQSSYSLEPFKMIEFGFLVIYYVELIVRFIAGGCEALMCDMVPFDILMVVIGTIAAVCVMVVGYDDSTTTMKSFQIVLVLRVLRLLRLIRALRLAKNFEALWKLIHNLFRSVSAMLSTVALITVSLYIAACFAVELVAKDTLLRSHPETEGVINAHFSSIATIMMSFVQFVTMDSISAIYWPLVQQRQYLFPYFAVIIVIVSIALMNLVTANLLEASITHTYRDKEMERTKLRSLTPVIYNACEVMDADGDGSLNREEVATCYNSLPYEVVEIVPQERFLELFDMLDVDNSGLVTEDEFSEGIMQLVMSSDSFTSLQQFRFLTQIMAKQERCIGELMCIHTRLKYINKPHEVNFAT